MNMNKLIATLSIAVILGVSSISFASGESIDAFELEDELVTKIYNCNKS